jgi:hypothetical protein
LRAALERNAAFNSADPLPPGDEVAHRLRG